MSLLAKRESAGADSRRLIPALLGGARSLKAPASAVATAAFRGTPRAVSQPVSDFESDTLLYRDGAGYREPSGAV